MPERHSHINLSKCTYSYVCCEWEDPSTFVQIHRIIGRGEENKKVSKRIPFSFCPNSSLKSSLLKSLSSLPLSFLPSFFRNQHFSSYLFKNSYARTILQQFYNPPTVFQRELHNCSAMYLLSELFRSNIRAHSFCMRFPNNNQKQLEKKDQTEFEKMQPTTKKLFFTKIKWNFLLDIYSTLNCTHFHTQQGYFSLPSVSKHVSFQHTLKYGVSNKNFISSGKTFSATFCANGKKTLMSIIDAFPRILEKFIIVDLCFGSAIIWIASLFYQPSFQRSFIFFFFNSD